MVTTVEGAELRLPHVFGNGMVLQREMKVPVWGRGEPGAAVTVEFAGQKKNGRADETSKWMVMLDPMPASAEPGVLTVSGSGTQVSFSDVLVGEVWLCSGQSNMEMPVGPANQDYRGVTDYEAELQDATYPLIRFLNVPRSGAAFPAPDTPMSWVRCSPESAQWFSAVAFSFGREMYKRQGVPVGLINASLGGAYIKRFMPREGMTLAPEYFAEDIRLCKEADGKYFQTPHISPDEWSRRVWEYAEQTPAQPPSAAWTGRDYSFPESGHECTSWDKPSALFNGMIEPVSPYAIRGVIWYQGESDLAKGRAYADGLRALITSWRRHWGQGCFPFYAVQIAPFDYAAKGWPMKNPPAGQRDELNAGIRGILTLENTGVVSTEDLGEMDNIHPRNKMPIGLRLADLAATEQPGK